jgi:hypothetical protein
MTVVFFIDCQRDVFAFREQLLKIISYLQQPVQELQLHFA